MHRQSMFTTVHICVEQLTPLTTATTTKSFYKDNLGELAQEQSL